MTVFLKSILGDYFLCVAASSALAYTLFSGFYATQTYQTLAGGLMTVAISAVLLAWLFAMWRDTKRKIISSVVALIVFAAALVVSFRTNPGSAVLDDIAGNNTFFVLIALAVPIVVFLLSRRRVGSLVLIVLGVLMCAIVEYLYWYGHVVAFAIFAIASVGLYIYRTYMLSVLNSDSDRLSFGSVTVSGVALALVSLLIAGGAAFALTSQVDMPNLTVKLLTMHYQVDEEEVKGVGNEVQTENLNILSNIFGDQTVQSNDSSGTRINAIVQGQSNLGTATEQEVAAAQAQQNPNGQNDTGGGGSLGMKIPNWLPFAIVGLIVLLIFAAILLKKLMRKRTYESLLVEGDNGKTVQNLYLFFMERFSRMKMPTPESATLSEYAQGQAETFSRFEQTVGSTAFPVLTRTYINSAYGGKEVSDDEVLLFKAYYNQFYKRASKFVGKLKYLLLFFRM